jgi:hypothetical protein
MMTDHLDTYVVRAQAAALRRAAPSAAETLDAAADELDQLRRWKAEAMVVLAGWDEVWEAVEKPGLAHIGRIKSEVCLEEIQRLQSEVESLQEVKPGASLEQVVWSGVRDPHWRIKGKDVKLFSRRIDG